MPLKRYHQIDLLEAGCDEAGRGCLAGSVFAAAVILDENNPIEALNDSKQLSASTRDALRMEVEEKALAWAVASVSPQEIDEINILQASFLAMHRAIDQLKTRPELLLIDGNRFVPYLGISHLCIIKGDAKYQSIAAASILAKTHRDAYMKQIGDAHPAYDWQQNKGYPTVAHRAAIQKHGVTPYHRLSFRMQK
jgi:ribonuclease HII